jgi:hypothetical protein
MNKTLQQQRFVARLGIGVGCLLMASAAWAAEPAKEATEAVPVEETPVRQPPTTTDANGKTVAAAPEKLVLADPASKMYMPCRDPNDSKSTDDDSASIKPNPKAAVLSEEAAKQHGYKPSPHKATCPKQGEVSAPKRP